MGDGEETIDMLLDGSLHITGHPDQPINTPEQRQRWGPQLGKLGAHVGVTGASLAAGVAERALRDVAAFFVEALGDNASSTARL